MSLALTWLLIGVFLKTSIADMFIDIPNHRSAHVDPVARIGGLALITTALGIALYLVNEPIIILLNMVALGLMVISLIDDRIGLSAKLRLVIHLAAAVEIIWFSQQGNLLVMILLVGAITWMTNLFNFMDGADGFAGGMAVVGFGAYAAAASMAGDQDLLLLSGVIAAASLGFLMWNFPPAKMFLGDCGAIPLGFLAAGVGLIGYERGAWGISYPVLVFLPFIFDATLTLLKRLIAGKNIFKAHREHVYQALSELPGWSKRRLVCSAYLLMFVIAASALGVETASGHELIWTAGLLLGWLVVLSLIAMITARSVRHQAQTAADR